MYPWLGAMMTVLALSYSCGAFAFNSFSVTTPRHYNDLQRKLFAQQQQHHLATPHHFTTRSRRRITTTSSRRLLVSSSKSSSRDDDDEPPTQEVEVVTESLTTSQKESLKDNQSSFLSNIKRAFTSKKKMDRESLSKMGMSALLAYGFVSNISGVIAVSSAWFIFSKKTGISPLAPGQKPAFLATYAAFFAMLNVIRPARFALSVAISPYFERIRQTIQRKFGVSAKASTVLVVIFVNLIGTTSLMALGVGMASLLSGVPVWAGR